MKRSLEEIEDELDDLQMAYINEDDDMMLIELESKFRNRLKEATDLDGVDRISANVTINNWSRESISKR